MVWSGPLTPDAATRRGTGDAGAIPARGVLQEKRGAISDGTPKMSSGEPMTDHTAGQREPSAPSRGSVANHDAVPAAIASVESVVPQPTTHGDSDRTDKAAPRPSEGTGNTQETQTTPGECSKPRDGTSEPVAWWVRGCEYDTGCEYEFVALLKEQAELAATPGGKAVPLYQSPSLTDAEREAVEIAVEYVGSAFQVEHHAAVLRGLLERLG